MDAALLRQLHADGKLVDLRRERQTDVRGYIEAMTDEFLLIAVAGDNVTLDGFAVIRAEDVEFVRWGTDALEAWSSALQYQHETARRAEFVALSDWRSIISSIALHERLITFHLSDQKSGVCYIGTAIRFEGDAVVAECVSTDGSIDGHWALMLDDISQIDFGRAYERGLARMLDLRNGKAG